MTTINHPLRLLIALLLVLLTGSALAQPGGGAFLKSNRVDLVNKARNQGEIHIIVGLQVPSAALPIAAQAGPSVLQKRMRDIAAAQTSFLSRQTSSDIRQIKKIQYHPYIAVRVSEWGLSQILQDPNVVSVEEDRVMRPTLTTTPGQVSAIPAWNAGYTGVGQAVAVLDTGVDTAHPFLSGKTVAEACFSEPRQVGDVGLCPNGQSSQIGAGAGINCTNCDHGTHVAGTAVGKRGVLGVDAGGMAPGASLIPIQVFVQNCTGGCALGAYTSDLVLALDHVYSLRNTHTIAAVNMSLGGSPTASPCDNDSPSMTASINSLRAANIATVIAAGNDGNANLVSFPACISSAISVGSTTKTNVVSSFSNGGSAVELFAPGSGIYSSVPGGGYATFNGTSMATPHVAGAWATLKSARPLASVTDALNAFTGTGLPILDARNGITKPLIQINAAINALGNAPPSVTLTAPANNASYTAPASITLDATATDSDGSINRVEFYNGANLLNTDTAAPYSFNWSNVAAGVYSLTAKAYDNANAVTTSAVVNVTVNGAGPLNVAGQANGGVASASSSYSSNFPAAAVNNADRKGTNWGAGGGWNDATPSQYPDWVQVTFNGQKSIDEIDVFTVQDNYTNPATPTASMTFTQYGITAFEVQYWDGASWLTVPGGSISGNNLVWRKISFASITTDRIRVLVNASLAGYCRVTEIEAYGP